MEYYDRKGNIVNIDPKDPAYAEIWDPDRRRVAETTIGVFWVSTVHLPIDHAFGSGGKPLIFETMVFSNDDDDSRYVNRYSTEEEALEGHDEAVKWVRDTLIPTPTIEEDPDGLTRLG